MGKFSPKSENVSTLSTKLEIRVNAKNVKTDGFKRINDREIDKLKPKSFQVREFAL